MKNGKSLQELAQELDRQRGAKQDFVVDTSEMTMSSADGSSRIAFGDDDFGVSDHTHTQIGHRLNIPRRFYSTLLEEQPDLLDHNVNELFKRNPERRMVRTLDGRARAFMSDRYKRVDNFPIMEASLTALHDVQDMEIESSQVTDRRLYIQARFGKTETAIKVNDPVQAGIVISNSEIGCGAIKIEQLIYRLICTNGMISARGSNAGGMNQYHVGRKIEGDLSVQVLSTKTVHLEEKALLSKITDVVRHFADPKSFEQTVDRMKLAVDTPAAHRPVEAVKLLADDHNLLESETNSVMEHLLRDGDYSQWGMLNAVTRTAEDVGSYDRSIELERLGGDILEYNAKQWNRIAVAEAA